MPEFVIEVTSKRTFGPFTYPSAGAAREDIISGNLKMDEAEAEDNNPVTFKIKEVKDSSKPLFDEGKDEPHGRLF